MAFTFGFYNALNHDRRYNAIQVSSIFDGIIKDGIFMSIGGHMNVKATGNGFNIVVESGRAWFNHTWSLLDADYPMVVSPSDVLEDRIDVVVLEVNENVDVRQNFIKIIAGTPAEHPTKPALTNNLDIHQYALAYITVPANSVTLTQSNVENAVGLGSTPFVTGILETINIDDLVAQWKSQWNDWTEEVDLNWNNWFDTVDNAWTTWFTQQQSKWEDILADRTEEWEEIKDTVDSEWASQQGSINSDYTNWKSSALAAYNQWLDQIKGTLDDDAATQLAKEVVELKNRDDVISTYQHVKSGAEHMFIGSGSNGKVKMTADIASGDKVVVSSAPKEKITVEGATSQPGSGDPSPENIRMIDGIGMYDQCVVLDGSSDEAYVHYSTWTNPNAFAVEDLRLPASVTSSPTIVAQLKSSRFKDGGSYNNVATGNKNEPFISGRENALIVSVPNCTTESEARAYIKAHPLTVWYRSVDFYKCKGPFYYVHEVSDGTESPYKAIGIELNSPLFDGDSLEIGGLSGFDQMVVLDGSEEYAHHTSWIGNPPAFEVIKAELASAPMPYTPTKVPALASSAFASGLSFDAVVSSNFSYPVISGRDDNFVVSIPGITSPTEAKAYFQAHPLTVFYKSVNYTPEADIAVALESHVKKLKLFDGTEDLSTLVGYFEHIIPDDVSSGTNLGLAKKTQKASHGTIANADGKPGSNYYWAYTENHTRKIRLKVAGVSDIPGLKSFLSSQYSAGTPVQLVYELASSATYAHPIQTESLPVYYGTEDFVTALAGEPVTDKWLTFTNDGTQLNFKGGGGVGVSKLAATTAVPADVVQGKTFYSKDKTLKTGTIVDRPALNDAVSVGNDGSYIYYRINQGAYRTNQASGYPEIRASNNSVISNIPGGNNGAWSGTYSGSNVTIPKGYHNGSGSVGVAGGNRGAWSGTYSGSNVTIPQGYHSGGGSVSVSGGNRGNWGATINPGGSVTIPQGYHAGGGVVRSNGGGSWPLRHMGFDDNNQLGTYTVGAPDGEGTYAWVFEGIVSWGNDNSGLEFHFFENNFGPVYGERNSHITSGKNYFTSSTTVQVRYWGGFADLWYIRIA